MTKTEGRTRTGALGGAHLPAARAPASRPDGTGLANGLAYYALDFRARGATGADGRERADDGAVDAVQTDVDLLTGVVGERLPFVSTTGFSSC